VADLTPQERLQPCLLDRLTDEQPAVHVEGRDRRVVSIRQLRDAVLRDTAWLLNASAHLTPEEAAECPLAARSVVNFGMPDLTGMTASSVNTDSVEEMVREAVERFEPRILAGTVRVVARSGAEENSHNAIVFEIHGDLWAQPVPEPLYLRTEIDLETGQCSLEARADG
jgi:type VI secretion system protein ImpF